MEHGADAARGDCASRDAVHIVLAVKGFLAFLDHGDGQELAVLEQVVVLELVLEERLLNFGTEARGLALVGEVGAVVLNDRKLLAEDGMVVVVLSMSSHDHQLLCPPEIVTRGFVYVKESEELLRQLRDVAQKTVDAMPQRKRRDDGEVSRAVRSAVSSYLYKNTKRSPMVIPMVTKL